MKRRVAFFLLVGSLALTSGIGQVAAAQQPSAEQQAQQQAFEAQMKALQKSLHPQFGRVPLPAAKASLELGDAYYFLPAADAKRVLVEAWGNPPSSTEGVLGLIFPAGQSFADGTWGAVVSYEETGHVSDHDAASQDYESVLSDMKQAAEENNAARKAEGYPATHVVGWAQAPTFDAASKTLIWARDIRFDDSPDNTLNYDVRTLGRTGVLSLNMVDGMVHLPQVRSVAANLGATVRFDAGARYADYDPATDASAEFGLAGLVAAGAGLGVAKKAGILGVLAVFLKKGVALLFAAGAGLAAWFRRRFGGGYREQDEGDDA